MRYITQRSYNAALAFANKIRHEALGLPPVEMLPLSVRYDARECAIARAVGPLSGIRVGTTVAVIGTQTFVMPDDVRQFIREFDHAPVSDREVAPTQAIIPTIFDGAAAEACGCVVCLGKMDPTLEEMLASIAVHDPVRRDFALARMSEKSDVPQGVPENIPAQAPSQTPVQQKTAV